MQTAKIRIIARVSESQFGVALMLVLCLAIAGATTLSGQTTVFVPGNATGSFGSPVDLVAPFVSAITVTGPADITVSYISGLVTWDNQGDTAGPTGTSACTDCDAMQFPLDEANGDGIRNTKHLGALIGAFVPKYRVNGKGFQAIDGTKNAASLGIKPELLRLIGEEFTFHVKEAGTVFLGINDTIASDNSGGFTVTVSAVAP
jgi:hypothetical protein